jgi:methyl-accepting chemotaxis protein
MGRQMNSDKIVKKGYIARLVLLAVSIFMAGSAVSSGLFFLTTHTPLSNTHYSAALSIISEFRNSLIIKSLQINLFFFFLIAIGIIILGVLYSHRIAGPLYRIKQYAGSISKGDLGSEIKFREKDVIHPFAESINKMTESCGERVRELASEAVQLKKEVEHMKSLSERGEETAEAMENIKAHDERIKEIFETLRL